MITLRISPETSGDVFLMSMSGAFEPKPLIVTPAYDGGAQLSPDGRWLLYQSDASGRPEIYVRRIRRWIGSGRSRRAAACQARWSRNNREIYYRCGGRIVAVSLDASGAEPVFGKPTALFTDDYDFGGGASIANYDVTPDGRFIMIRRGHEWREAASRRQLDGRAEADSRGRWRALNQPPRRPMRTRDAAWGPWTSPEMTRGYRAQFKCRDGGGGGNHHLRHHVDPFPLRAGYGFR